MAHDQGVMTAGPGTKPGTDHAVDHHEEHPSERVYINIALILTAITFAEVVVYYVPAVRSFLVPMLIVMSLAKFVTVIGYYMHLKFDDRRFTWIFVGGLAIALAVFVAVVFLQYFHEVTSFFSDLALG